MYVYSPTREHAESFAQDVAGKSPIPSNIVATDTAEDAVRQADIVCTATTSFRPVFDGAVIQPGAHINAVGSFRPSMQEVDVTTVQRSLIVVDSREAIMEEAGDLLVPIEAGILSEDDIHAEIGEVALGQATRTHLCRANHLLQISGECSPGCSLGWHYRPQRHCHESRHQCGLVVFQRNFAYRWSIVLQ